MLIHRLTKDGLAHPPKWLADNTAYLTAMGSVAYGVSGDMSDIDVYGFAFPPKDHVFPHLAGHIPGFGPAPQNFECWQEHHIKDVGSQKEYDFQVFSVVRYFHLIMDNNPNMIDSLFTPDRCVLHSTAVSDMVRERRREFLHAGSYHRFRGYAYQQLKKIKAKVGSENPKRAASIEAYGYDVKAAYHVVRLALEAEQILNTGDLQLDQNTEILSAIRRGEWTFERLETWFADKERGLENAYTDTKLPRVPDFERAKTLLLTVLEHHYGNLNAAVVRQTNVDQVLKDLQSVLDRYS